MTSTIYSIDLVLIAKSNGIHFLCRENIIGPAVM